MKDHKKRLVAHRAMIGQVTVTSQYQYIVCRPGAGIVSEHRTLHKAVRSCDRDWKAGYSDARVYSWMDNTWCSVTPSCVQIPRQ
jgi:hypothetical protein